MAINPANAAAAYQQMARIGAGNTPGAAATGASGEGFGSLLNDAMKEAVGTMRTGEEAAAQGATGKGDIVQVVNAVTSAELTLETVVAIRDRVIAAYQDIIKMPI
jgi:flagellar hook-basal body complex protein FliE